MESNATVSGNGISVVMPLYNKAGSVSRAINSALSQGVDVEVIVVDDGSTDGSDAVARDFNGRIIYVRQRNTGPALARNRGVQMSSRPRIAFLDADDEFLPGCLAAHLACHNARPDVCVTLSPFRLFVDGKLDRDDPIVQRTNDFVSDQNYHYTNRFHRALITGMASGSICVRRDVFDAVGGFDPTLRCYEITDFLYRLLVRFPSVGVLDRPYVAIHADRENSQFARAATDLKYRLTLTQHILEEIDNLDEDQQVAMLTPVEECLNSLLTLGAVEEFQRLSQRLNRVSYRSRQLKALCTLAARPRSVILTASMVRRAGSFLARPLRKLATQNHRT